MPLVFRRYALERNVLDYVKGYMDLRNTKAEYPAPQVDLTNAKDNSLKVIYVNKQWRKSKSPIPTENDVTEHKSSIDDWEFPLTATQTKSNSNIWKSPQKCIVNRKRKADLKKNATPQKRKVEYLKSPYCTRLSLQRGINVLFEGNIDNRDGAHSFKTMHEEGEGEEDIDATEQENIPSTSGNKAVTINSNSKYAKRDHLMELLNDRTLTESNLSPRNNGRLSSPLPEEKFLDILWWLKTGQKFSITKKPVNLE